MGGMYDDDVPTAETLVAEAGTNSLVQLNFSNNKIRAAGLARFLRPTWLFSELRVLKLYKNQITDRAADIIIPAASQREWNGVILWVRFEQNEVENAGQLLESWEKQKLSICCVGEGCRRNECQWGMSLHVPYFTLQ